MLKIGLVTGDQLYLSLQLNSRLYCSATGDKTTDFKLEGKLGEVINMYLKVLSLLFCLFCSACFYPSGYNKGPKKLHGPHSAAFLAAGNSLMCLHVNEHTRAIFEDFTGKPLYCLLLWQWHSPAYLLNTVSGLIKGTGTLYNKQIQSTQKLPKNNAKNKVHTDIFDLKILLLFHSMSSTFLCKEMLHRQL